MGVSLHINPGGVTMAKLQNKVSVVTGGGSGIGRSSAKLFAAEGAKTLVVDMDEKGGAETVSQIKAQGGSAYFVKADVTSEKSCTDMIQTAVKKFGGVDVLLNAVGMPGHVRIENLPLEDWKKIIDVNLTSVFLTSKYAVPEMRKRGGGSIINISSSAGLVGSGGGAPYSAAKGGVVLLTKSLALVLAKDKIRVNAICPGGVDTPMNIRFFAAAENPEEARAKYLSSIPLGRLAKPEEIAAAALYLASEDAAFTTGIAMPVDGGIVAK
jgi:NAD(P)-dependent dehydrogenase (short-subunit alcohol dehydrogenase family)